MLESQLNLSTISRSCRPEVFCIKDVLKHFIKFTGKRLCQSVLFSGDCFYISWGEPGNFRFWCSFLFKPVTRSDIYSQISHRLDHCGIFWLKMYCLCDFRKVYSNPNFSSWLKSVEKVSFLWTSLVISPPFAILWRKRIFQIKNVFALKLFSCYSFPYINGLPFQDLYKKYLVYLGTLSSTPALSP